MAALRYPFRAELRARWRTWAALALLVGLTGGVVVAALAGARRTETAFDRFLVSARSPDVVVYGVPFPSDMDQVRRLPEVVVAASFNYGWVFPDLERTPALTSDLSPFFSSDGFYQRVNRPRVVAGRRPDPDDPHEAAITPIGAESTGLGVGDTLVMKGLTPEQAQAELRGEDPGPPAGPSSLGELGFVDGFILAEAPRDVADFGRVDDMPVVLAGLLGLIAGATLVHALVTAVHAGGATLAVLKILGFTPGQVRATVVWQATALVAAAAIGIPLGVAAGRWAWQAFADGLGIVPAPVVPLFVVLATIPAGVLLANLAAALPARAAGRTKPATVLLTIRGPEPHTAQGCQPHARTHVGTLARSSGFGVVSGQRPGVGWARIGSSHMSMRKQTSWCARAGGLVVVALIAAACSSGDDTKTVTAVDYGFENLPSSVKPGTTLTLKNASTKELHEMVVVRLPDEERRSVEELVRLPEAQLDALFTGPPAMVLIAPPGGADTIVAVGDGKLTEKGRYLVICAIPTGADPAAYLQAAQSSGGGPPQVAGGPPHLTQGMFGQITVA